HSSVAPDGLLTREQGFQVPQWPAPRESLPHPAALRGDNHTVAIEDVVDKGFHRSPIFLIGLHLFGHTAGMQSGEQAEAPLIEQVAPAAAGVVWPDDAGG